jgi:hypothetical protein
MVIVPLRFVYLFILSQEKGYKHTETRLCQVADIFDWDGIDPKTGLPRPMPGGMKHRAEVG